MVVVSEGVAFLKSRCIKNPVSGLLNSETHGISRAVAHSTRITVAYKSRRVIVDSLLAPVLVVPYAQDEVVVRKKREINVGVTVDVNICAVVDGNSVAVEPFDEM